MCHRIWNSSGVRKVMRCTEICHVRAIVWFTVEPRAHRFNRALPSLLEGQRSTTVSSLPKQEVPWGELQGEISAVPTGRPHAFQNMSPWPACPSLSGGAPSNAHTLPPRPALPRRLGQPRCSPRSPQHLAAASALACCSPALRLHSWRPQASSQPHTGGSPQASASSLGCSLWACALAKASHPHG